MFSIFHRQSASFYSASKKERQEAIEKLIAQGTMKNGYYLLLILATCVVVPGLFMENTSIVIGGMILAPLLIPILSFSLSLVAFNGSIIKRSLLILLYSIIIVIVTSSLLTWVLLIQNHPLPATAVQASPLMYVFISFCSGMAGALGWVKENLSATIAGVATAVALLPPLAQVGIGLTAGDYSIALTSLQIFFANFVGISSAACIVFLVLGFIDTAKIQDKVLDDHKN